MFLDEEGFVFAFYYKLVHKIQVMSCVYYRKKGTFREG